MCGTCGCKSAESGKKNCGCGQDPCITFGAEYFFDKDFSHVKTYDDYRKEFNRIKKEFGHDGEFMRFKIDQLHDYCSRNVKGVISPLQQFFIEQEITWRNPEDIRQTIVDFELEGYAEADLILNDDKALNEFADALMKAGRTETKAVPIMWEDYYGDDDGDNNGKIYGISYTDGYEVLDMEWFTTAKERDAEIAKYNKEFDAETFEAEKCECKNYTPNFNQERPMTTDDEEEQAVIVPITCDDCGKKGQTVYLYGYNEYDNSNLKWFDAETTCASCGEGIDEDDIIGDGTNRGLCCVPDYYDEPEMVHCSFCSKIIGTEEEVYDEESVEWYNANGETICPTCHKQREEELRNDLDPHYTPFYAETPLEKEVKKYGLSIEMSKDDLIAKKLERLKDKNAETEKPFWENITMSSQKKKEISPLYQGLIASGLVIVALRIMDKVKK